MATKNENISVRDVNPPFTKFHGFDSKIVPHLQRFGMMGVVTTKKKIQGKDVATGKVAIFVGYAENHAGDTYRMFKYRNEQDPYLMRCSLAQQDVWKMEK